MNPFGIIHAERARFPVRVLCELLGVSRAGYYAWRDRKPSARAQSEERIVVKISAIQMQTKHAYGSPRMVADLREDGERIGIHRVARLMRKHGLNALQKKRFARTTDSAHDAPIAKNLLARNFKTSAPNRVWAGDITYLRTQEGWAYLSVLLDLYSRAVVGWSLDRSLHTAGPLRALRQALGARQPAEGLIHHTDRGCQYASAAYRAVLDEHGVIQSMSRAGDCWDNAVSESFFASFKKERVRGAIFDSFNHAHRVASKYIDGFYNPRRRHSSAAGLSPFDFEAIHAKQPEARIAA